VNFIFDIGNVLAEFKPLEYLENRFSDKSIVEKMNTTIFKSREWILMDAGELTQKEAIDVFCQREPEYCYAIHETFRDIGSILTPMTDTIALLPEIKNSGHSLYYLSNLPKELSIYMTENFDYFDLFDGGVFSCDPKLIKPFPEIYRYLLSKYDLKAQDCLFFDDIEANISAAEKEGIKGVLFTTADCVLEYL